jgi:hypothetical protein
MHLNVRSTMQATLTATRETLAAHPMATRVSGAVVGAAVLGGLAYAIFHHRPTAKEIETERRKRLLAMGRLIDGMIVDAEEPSPGTVMYSYRVGGVEYVCGQDLTPLGTEMEKIRMDQPVQVKYDVRNPYNSIVAAEGWTGLRSRR